MVRFVWHKQGITTLCCRSSVGGKCVAGSYLMQEPKVQSCTSAFHHEGTHHQPQVLSPCQVVVDPEKDCNVGTRDLLIRVPAMHAASQKPNAICRECAICLE